MDIFRCVFLSILDNRQYSFPTFNYLPSYILSMLSHELKPNLVTTQKQEFKQWTLAHFLKEQFFLWWCYFFVTYLCYKRWGSLRELSFREMLIIRIEERKEALPFLSDAFFQLLWAIRHSVVLPSLSLFFLLAATLFFNKLILLLTARNKSTRSIAS